MRALILALVVGLFAAIPTSLLPTHAQSSALAVRAGDGEPGYAVNAFLPASITVSAGTTVRWDFPWFEPHTVTFGVPQSGAPPATPSGADYNGSGFHTSELLFGPGKAYEVRFPVPGVFTYYCVIHADMTGTVTVVDAAGEEQDEVIARGDREFDVAVDELKDTAAGWAAQPEATNPLPDGTTEHVVAIAGATSSGDVQQFFPPRVTIDEDDTVRWHSVVRTPHTATFGPFPSGLPIVGNPAVDNVSRPGDAYEGVGYWNSGVIGVDGPLGLDFSMTFAKPGTYSYYCILHASQGMVGEVVVLPRPDVSASPTPGTEAPRPPSTGTGNETGRSDAGRLGSAAATALVSVAAVCLLVAAFAGRRH